ncbi:hypothetical protein HYZ99_03265 [Candidatus Peregrinibacteria bacterium]|nr:hypothetical protein [Candidatus Peregrinibacteria bacterium]
MHTPKRTVAFLLKKRMTSAALALFVSGLLASVPRALAATSAWSPTLLVNTESFQTIDEGDSTTDVELRFGGTLNEKIYWDRTNAEFRFTDDIRADGNITGSGTLTVSGNVKTKADLTINADAGAADAVLTFGSDSTNETLKFLNAEDRFEFSDDLNATGVITASGALVIGGSATIKGDITINADQTAADTVLTFGSDTTNETVTFKNAEDRFEFSDDVHATGVLTASGALSIGGAGSVKGDFTINADQTAADTVLTFGSDTTNETVTFKNAEDRFEFSEDVHTTGTLSATGAVTFGGAAVFKSTIRLNGVTYTFPAFDGSASGKVLKTDGAGQLSWSADIDTQAAAVTRNSGSMIFLNPEYPHAIYFQSGAATSAVGSLGLRYDSGSTVNFYRWQSTKTSNQNYWIISRVRIPDQFSGWESTKPMEFRYRASGGWLEVRALDTNNTPIPLTGGSSLKATTWTTATITGPEAGGAFASGSYITLMIKMVSSGAAVTDRAYADASWFNFNIETKK